MHVDVAGREEIWNKLFLLWLHSEMKLSSCSLIVLDWDVMAMLLGIPGRSAGLKVDRRQQEMTKCRGFVICKLCEYLICTSYIAYRIVVRNRDTTCHKTMGGDITSWLSTGSGFGFIFILVSHCLVSQFKGSSLTSRCIRFFISKMEMLIESIFCGYFEDQVS